MGARLQVPDQSRIAVAEQVAIALVKRSWHELFVLTGSELIKMGASDCARID